MGRRRDMSYRGNDVVLTKRRTRFYFLSIVVSVVLSLVALVSYFSGTSSFLSGIVNIVVSPLNDLGNSAVEKVMSVGNYFGDIARLKEENLRLQAENAELAKENAKHEAIRDENERLYSYLELKREFSELSLVNAQIIYRGSGNIITSFTLDKGTLHGVKKDMPIVCPGGIVGIIAEEGLTTSRAITLMSPKTSAGVYLLHSGVSGVLEGDYTLSLDGKCKISGLAQDTDVKVGDFVYTSGYGDIFPKDLCVGTVSEIIKDANTHTLTLAVTPMYDLANLDTVMVITDYTRDYKGQRA